MKSKARNYRRGLFILGMIALPMLNFLIFYVYVNFNSIVMAFQVLKEGELTWSMNNFVLFFEQITDTETVLFGALGNTMKFFSVQLFVLLPATTLIAYFIYKKIFGYRFFRIMFFVPTILSTVLLTILYSNLIGMNSPVAKLFQKLFSLPAVPEFLADKRYALNAIIVYVVWTGFGTNLILLSGAMNRIPSEVIEAARLDGVGAFRELVQIILPMVWPTMTTLLVFTFVGIFTTSGPILMFTEGQWDTYTVAYWIFEQVYSGGRYEYASAVGLIFTLIALPIVLSVKKLMERWQESVDY